MRGNVAEVRSARRCPPGHILDYELRGVDEQSFVWSDMPHYRQTSLVPKMLERARDLHASTDPVDQEHAAQLVAYATAWITHVGTDVLGHSFVNAQAGGPFRTHWQRHHLVENHLDAYNYEGTGNGILPPDEKVGWIDTYEGLNHSALYFAVQMREMKPGTKYAKLFATKIELYSETA